MKSEDYFFHKDLCLRYRFSKSYISYSPSQFLSLDRLDILSHQWYLSNYDTNLPIGKELLNVFINYNFTDSDKFLSLLNDIYYFYDLYYWRNIYK